ncbi:hypothetical protein T440DRAFT_524595 [Plenodomus tracheiphilus IPT5]|uniref:Heterokaryon incompatibility domain-containing protein n=1 Tax=Plenodomus tracheiphilus IPT5 TaxID=1408161 RepID=A0A6A7BQV3_9PLEO|nr:hypothetical protein T440DRAFT_524595 [Plenodomus tracheiphilus IPT5]
MRQLRLIDRGDYTSEPLHLDHNPPYAALSYVWGNEPVVGEEVMFEVTIKGMGRIKIRCHKLDFARVWAGQNGLPHLWIDACCIAQSDSTELSDSINYILRWYKDASQCYMYLNGVSFIDSKCADEIFESTITPIQHSRFRRGWNLQKLLALRISEYTADIEQRIGNDVALVYSLHHSPWISANDQELQLSRGVIASQYDRLYRFIANLDNWHCDTNLICGNLLENWTRDTQGYIHRNHIDPDYLTVGRPNVYNHIFNQQDDRLKHYRGHQPDPFNSAPYNTLHNNFDPEEHPKNTWSLHEFRLSLVLVAVGSALGVRDSTHQLLLPYLNHPPNFPISLSHTIELLGLAGFTTSTISLYNLSADDVHLDRWIIFGIVGGVGGGLAAGLDLRVVILKVLPWAVLTMFVFSWTMQSIRHGIMRRRGECVRLKTMARAHLKTHIGE